MVVIRKNGNMDVYFNSSNNPNNSNEILSENRTDNKTKINDNTSRECQKNLIEDSPVRDKKMSESILVIDEQKRIRKKLNSEQKNNRINFNPMKRSG